MSQQKRKLVYYVAVTLDGFIAHEDGSFEGFAGEGPAVADYLADLQTFDTVLMGRSTYEVGYQYGVQPGDPSPMYAHMMQYVISSTMEPYDNAGLKVIQKDITAFVRTLKNEDGSPIYLCGGGQLAGSLMAHGLVDEVILKLNPIAFGKGIPVFGALVEPVNMALSNTKIYDDGLVFLTYQVAV